MSLLQNPSKTSSSKTFSRHQKHPQHPNKPTLLDYVGTVVLFVLSVSALWALIPDLVGNLDLFLTQG